MKITSIDSEGSGYVRGRYNYNILTMQKDLEEYLRENDIDESDHDWISNWIRENEYAYRGELELVRDDTDMSSMGIEFDSGDVIHIY